MLLQAGAMLFDIAAATTPGAAWGADHLPVQRQADTAEQQTAHPQEKQTPVPVEVAIKLPDGSSALYELSVSPLKTRAETARWIIVGRDLTSIRRMEEKMRMQAVFDGLTGLFNHTHFHMLLLSSLIWTGSKPSTTRKGTAKATEYCVRFPTPCAPAYAKELILPAATAATNLPSS
jgi:hypothetical protein